MNGWINASDSVININLICLFIFLINYKQNSKLNNHFVNIIMGRRKEGSMKIHCAPFILT